MVGRNKVLESLERRRKSAAKRFAIGLSNSKKRRHGKAQFRFTKVVEENEVQKQSTSKPNSLMESIPSQTLPKLIFKKKPDTQEEYECISKEEVKTFVQNENTDNENASNHVSNNEGMVSLGTKSDNGGMKSLVTESLVTESSVKKVGRTKIESVQGTIKVCFKKRGRPKTKKLEKDVVRNPTKTKKLEKDVRNSTKSVQQNKKEQQIKNSQPRRKKSKPNSSDIQGKKKKIVPESPEIVKVKKRGRPKKIELESCVMKKPRINQETAVTPKKKGGRKKAQDKKTPNKPVTSKGKRRKRQKGKVDILKGMK
jgi:hypothetical protein